MTTTDTDTANARLKELAPSMLQALEELVGEWDGHWEDKCREMWPHAYGAPEDTGGIALARQVIGLVKRGPHV